jgi:ABC-2 type transport system ATP-binding protein
VTAGPDLAGLAVATRGVFKKYGRQPALRGLDMSVPTGKVYGFLGPNGSGKTTTMRLLAGLISPDAGTMTLFGEPYTWHDRTRLFRVGSLIETPAFYPYLSGRENLIVIAATGAPTPRSRVDEVLDYVGLKERAGGPVKTYSLGMRQRLGLAAAMLSDPDLLILDEPANGLDPGGMVALRETLRWVTGRGKTKSNTWRTWSGSSTRASCCARVRSTSCCATRGRSRSACRFRICRGRPRSSSS